MPRGIARAGAVRVFVVPVARRAESRSASSLSRSTVPAGIGMAGTAPVCFVTGPRGRELAEQATLQVYDLSSSAWGVGDDLDGLQHDGEGRA
jgi:hypothetical protein